MWVKLDDQFPDHPKVKALGALGLALQTTAICYCGRYLTDGFLPYSVVDALIASTFAEFTLPNGSMWKVAITSGMSGEDADAWDWKTAMVTSGLWDRCKGGYRVHDYLVYNPTKKDVEAVREKTNQRVTRFRSRHLDGSRNVVTNARETLLPSPSPSLSGTPTSSDVEHPQKIGVSADPSPGNGRGSAVPIDPQLVGWLLGTKNLQALADPKRGDLWATLERAYDRYEWLFFEPEIAKMDAWLEANPQRRPTERGLPRFVRSWFERAVNMGRTKHGQG